MKTIFSQIAITKLFQRNYIFEITPNSSGLYIYLTALFAAMILIAIGLFFVYKKPKYSIYKKIKNKIINLLLTIGGIGIFLILCRYQQIPYLGSRLMFLLLFLAAIIWAITIIYFRMFIAPTKIKEENDKKNFSKYLPQNKNSKTKNERNK